MKNYTIRVNDAKTGKLIYKESFQKQYRYEAMDHFMKFLKLDIEKGSVYLHFHQLGVYATINDDDSIEYFLVYC